MLRRIIPLPLLAVVLALIMALSAGCNERETRTFPIWQPDLQPPAKTYTATPESTSELLKDSSDAVKAKYPSNEGVHFTLESLTSGQGLPSSWRAEGDMNFPDRVKMTTRNFLSSEPVSEDVIDLDGQVYIRSDATGGVWRGGASQLPVPDPRSIADYLDFTRSSRNFGQETLPSGQKTWHVQVDVDTGMLAAAAVNRTTGQEDAQRLDSMKSGSVSVDFWIGNDDRLPYQMVVKTSRPDTPQTVQQTFIFSNWKEHAPIARPCVDC